MLGHPVHSCRHMAMSFSLIARPSPGLSPGPPSRVTENQMDTDGHIPSPNYVEYIRPTPSSPEPPPLYPHPMAHTTRMTPAPGPPCTTPLDPPNPHPITQPQPPFPPETNFILCTARHISHLTHIKSPTRRPYMISLESCHSSTW